MDYTSQIQRLAIRGIRSFGSNEEYIEFARPLTIILGANGSGKTTIIECLKIMASGTMPPSSNHGKSFIRDPKIDGVQEMMSSIKLKFKAVNNAEVVSLRAFKLTQRKDKAELRKVEQLMKYKDQNGVERSINSNCIDIDKQMPMLFGVSQAILDYVIFCHQDEALWPFSDQATLKSIFDELFETTKYTKVLESFRSTIKMFNAKYKGHEVESMLIHKDFEQYQIVHL